MKSVLGEWDEPNVDATNSSEFGGLPGGYRSYEDGGFIGIGYNGFWWSSTSSNTTKAWFRNLYKGYGQLDRDNFNKADGFSVRCLKN